jgi:hypothetical protein
MGKSIQPYSPHKRLQRRDAVGSCDRRCTCKLHAGRVMPTVPALVRFGPVRFEVAPHVWSRSTSA